MMLQFCPLCRKSGTEKRIKAVQINYEEAVWMCESETCTWPFGHEEFTFVSQKADFLDGCNSKSEVQEPKKLLPALPVISDLSMYTPPVTPIGDPYASTTANSTNSKYKPMPNIQIKKENEKDNVLEKKSHTLLVTPGIFDINRRTPGVRKLNSIQNQENKLTRSEVKNNNEIKTESVTNNTKSRNSLQKRPHIRSIEVTNVNVIEMKSEKDLNIKTSIKMIDKELKEKRALKKINGLTHESEVESKQSPSLKENNQTSKNLSNYLYEDHNYSQLTPNEVTYNSYEIDLKKENINNSCEILENKSNNEQSQSIVQNTECSNVENLSLNNILDEMLSNDLNSTENIDDEWLTSFFL